MKHRHQSITGATRLTRSPRLVIYRGVDENIPRTYITGFVPDALATGAGPCRRLPPLRFCRPVFTCFSDPESRNINSLLLIFLLRARKTGGCREAARRPGSREPRALSTRGRHCQCGNLAADLLQMQQIVI